MFIKPTYKIIDQIGVHEKYIRRNHFNTIKVWWARRPITTMRFLLIKETLLKSNNENDLIESELISTLNPSLEILNDFISKYKTKQLSVLDVFSGGGSIPLESARLGFKTLSYELNPIAYLAQETIFNSLKIY